MFHLLYRHQISTKPLNFNKLILFYAVKGTIYIFVAIATAIFSHVNLICYFQKLTWYFIGVCI